MTDLREHYDQKYPSLERTEKWLRSILEKVVATIEDKNLVRAEVRSLRIKKFDSVERKCRQKGWNEADALARCPDLVGGRVVCNNIEDVYRFVELLKEHLPSETVEVEDHIKEPMDGGYRALHINFRLDASKDSFQFEFVPCEVQVLSRLQDAWAELSHDDIYKQPVLSEGLRARAKDLAEILRAADKIASDIRSRVRQKNEVSDQHPDLSCVSPEGLTFIFREAFGRLPPDYTVRQALNLCEELGITSLERFPEILGRSEFRESLAAEYFSRIPVAPPPEEIFVISLFALAKNDKRALKEMRQKARKEWNELEQFARSEALSSLPETVEELIEELENTQDETGIEVWADAIGATRKCFICPTTIIDPYSFAESFIYHYEVLEGDTEEIQSRIEKAIRDSGVETGGWRDGTLCVYHANQMAEDD